MTVSPTKICARDVQLREMFPLSVCARSLPGDGRGLRATDAPHRTAAGLTTE
ncbi:MAG TPA: hypothetical protein H9881_02790 [Candidatus Stackebrandtia excrementipullorum]|nr:hypothetical protein [Candidatus Stackebrandtia excrementipullorum]